MKVCVVGLRGLPDISGGIETHCEHLYSRMSRENPGVEIVVYGRSPYIGPQSYTTSTGVRVEPAFALRNKYLETISNTLVSILRARFRERPDYMHIHAIGPGLLAPLARLLGARVILTHHGDDFKRAKWNAFVKFVLRVGERLGMASAEKVIAVSPSLANRLKSEYPQKAEQIHYVPNGADHIIARSLTGDAEGLLERFGLTENEYILTVGRLVPEKGFADLIRAHKEAGISIPLVIAGGKSHSSHDRELEELAHDGVILTGALSQTEIAHLLSHTRLFVLPSYHEGLPIAALEAGAMGAPLLLSDIVPNLDIKLPELHYFETGNVVELAERLATDALTLPSVDLLKEFSWTSIAKQTSDIYLLSQGEELIHDETA